MSFKPGDWFIGAIDFFGALVPGGIALLLLQAAAVRAGWIPASYQPDSPITWAGFLVGAFILGLLAHPPAHVLNRTYDRTYAARRRAGGDPALDYVRSAARGEVGANDSLYAWAKSEIGVFAEGALKRIDLLEGVSKMFRTLCLLALISVLVMAVAGEWVLAGTALVIALLSYYVFAERRFAATREVYQRFRRLREQKAGASIIRGG